VKSFLVIALLLFGALLAFGCVEQNGGNGNGEPTIPPFPSAEPSLVACTMDARACPDGSYVGRIAPDCEFAPCPSVAPTLTPNPSCPPITISCWCPGFEHESCPTKLDENGCTQWDIEACPQAAACSSDNDCAVGGCSGELCGAKGADLISTCIWREEFACYKKTTCGCVEGACAWKSNAAFDACLNGS